MSNSEEKLDTIFGQGNWEAPNLFDLRMAFTALDSTMKALAESPGWEGASAAAASEKWVMLQKRFGLVADAVDEVRSLITKGNAALARAKEAVDGAPAVVVPTELKKAAAAADVGAQIWVPALGKFKPASTAVSILENFLGNKRAEAADAAKATLEAELNLLAGNLNAVDFGDGVYNVPEPQKPEPLPDPSDGGGTPPPPSPGFRTGGGYTPPPNPVYTTPTYPGGSPATPIIGDPSYPYNPGYPSPSVDDGSGGTFPGGTGGNDPRFGGGNDPRYGGGGSGSGSGVNGAVFGGAAAAGAATLRFGIGGGFGGGVGGGGLGGGLGAGAAGGSGGLLGSGTSAAGAAGSGAGSGAAGSGAGAAGAGNRGGMMGGQQMGGGGQGGKKEKRAGLGGPIAPKLEDNEAEFVPLPDGARAGGRDISMADES